MATCLNRCSAWRSAASSGNFRAAKTLIREGERGDTIFIVLSGSIKAYSVNDSHRELVFGTYGAGDYVGEMSLDGGPRSASIVALEPTELRRDHPAHPT